MAADIERRHNERVLVTKICVCHLHSNLHYTAIIVIDCVISKHGIPKCVHRLTSNTGIKLCNVMLEKAHAHLLIL